MFNALAPCLFGTKRVAVPARVITTIVQLVLTLVRRVVPPPITVTILWLDGPKSLKLPLWYRAPFIQTRQLAKLLAAECNRACAHAGRPQTVCFVVTELECWTPTEDIHGFGGIPHNMTLDECLAACINNDTCVAVDWEPSNVGKTCWILASTVVGNTMDEGVITHYELDRPCAAGESSDFYCALSPHKRVSTVADEPTRRAASRQTCCKQRWTAGRSCHPL